jgi:hypothetical protein
VDKETNSCSFFSTTNPLQANWYYNNSKGATIHSFIFALLHAAKNYHGNIQAQHLSAGAFRQQEQHSRCMGALSARVTLSRVDAVAFCQQEQHSVPSALGNCSAG